MHPEWNDKESERCILNQHRINAVDMLLIGAFLISVENEIRSHKTENRKL